MTGRSVTNFCFASAIFIAGFFTHVLYQRWNPALRETPEANPAAQNAAISATGEPQSHRVNFVPVSLPAKAEENTAELPEILARDVEKIRSFTGKLARVRGRVFRVGHSAKSNTYFLNFGPTREALTAVIFSSTVELFDKTKVSPRSFENKEVEITGQVKDHPQYGLGIILENPKQIRIVN